MRLSKTYLPAGISASMLVLSACGDGGGGIESASTTPPPLTPTPQGTNAVIFATPTVGTYASAGVSATATGSGSTLGFNAVSKADADQVHIRYAAAGYYEIQMPGNDWDRLIIQKGAFPADPSTFNVLQPASAGQNEAFIGTSVSKLKGYTYSELASWSDFRTGKLGALAFGSPTPAGQVPVTGMATYDGTVSGTSDVVGYNSFDGHYRVPVNGSVNLNFNFGSGSLAGSMNLGLNDYTPTPLGTFTFKNTVFSAGSAIYSGQFDTGVAGQNFFFGQFTGPHAEETIGAWAVPFTYGANGETHQAIGAWIAKNH